MKGHQGSQSITPMGTIIPSALTTVSTTPQHIIPNNTTALSSPVTNHHPIPNHPVAPSVDLPQTIMPSNPANAVNSNHNHTVNRLNPYRQNNLVRALHTQSLELPQIVATAFHSRTLPPIHIQKRLATIETIPEADFPTYLNPPDTIPPQPTSALRQDHPQQNLEWGDSIEEPKPTNHTRLYFQNVYGLRLTTDGITKWQDCLRIMHERQCDIFGFAETNCNWSRNRVRHRIQGSSSYILPQFRSTTSRNSYIHDSDYLPGGTITCTHGPWSGRLQSELHDPHKMGRWSGQVYKVHSGHKLAVLTAYRVCKQQIQDGVYSSFKQQQLHLRARSTSAVNSVCPRHAFISDLIEYVTSLELSQNDYLLIMIDANEVLGDDAYGMVNLLEQLQLIDLLERYHQQSCDIATHATSKTRRIDYLLGTSNITQFITKCGYLPFQSGIDSDHRACFVELNQTFVDGRARLHTPPARMIGYNTNKNEVLKYKQYIDNACQSQDFFNRAKTLFDQAKPNMPDEVAFLKRLNKLDREITQTMLKGEKTQCSKKPPFLWSSTVHQASILIKYWTLKQQCDRKNKERPVQLRELYDQLNKENQKTVDEAHLTRTATSTTLLHRAKVDKQRIHLTNKNSKATTKRNRMNADADYYVVEPDQALKRIGMKEESSHLFRYLEKVYPKHKGSGISHIEIPYKDGQGNLTNDPQQAVEWVKITNPDEFIPMLMERNIAHFGQAQHSPFATSPLLEVFGYTGTTQSALDLIDRGIIPASCTTVDVHTGAQAILAKLADGHNLPVHNLDITPEEFWTAFQKWDERTSTSPSQRHLGHYKVLQMSDGNDKNYKRANADFDPEQDDLGPEKPPNPSEAIKMLYYHVAVAAVKSGNTLARWCQSSSLMLEKIPGSPRINKLRVIHIYEADYNLMLKILWARQLVWRGHVNQAFHEGQAGSRPDHRCSDVVIRKEMNYLYARLTRTALATVDNDGKACYDRILCNLAMMVSRYYGMSTEACNFHSKTLQAMKYRIRTTTSGDSSDHYQHATHTPIHGSGQGSCASPALWLLISSILLQVFDRTSHGMHQCDIKKGGQKSTNAEGFVDDIALFTNLHALTETDLPTLRRALSQDINTWQHTLAGSGGKLELIKCFYYILMWKFNKHGDPIPLNNDELYQQGHSDITITDPDTATVVTLDHKGVDEVHRTLGAFKTISGTEGAQYDILFDKSNQLAIRTSQGQLTRLQARRAYSSIYIPSISYSLVTTSLAPKLLTAIQSKAMLAFLPAMGFERTFPRSVVFGPRKFGGLNLSRLYTETCVAKIGAVISHIRSDTGLGRIILININWLQQHSGLLEPVFTNTTALPYIKQNWLLHMRDFLWHTQSQLSIPNQWLPRLQRHRDCSLMEEFSKIPSIRTDVLRIVNNWRLYFQVTTLSDIVTADGKRIQPRYWLPGRHSHTLTAECNTLINWPVQARPHTSQFGKWISCLNAAFRVEKTSGLLPYHRRLGDWYNNSKDIDHHWTYYFDPASESLYHHKQMNTWWVHHKQHQELGRCTPHKWIFHQVPDDAADTCPNTAFPVSVQNLGHNITVSHYKIQCTPTPYIRDIHTFEDHILQLPKWRGDLLMHWSSLPVNQLAKLVADNPRLIMASDGAFNEEQSTGSFGVVIGTHDDELMTNQGSAPGTAHLHSSFRSEMYGLLAGCLLLYEVTQYCGLPMTDRHELTIYIDNLGVVDRVNRHVLQPVSLCEMLAPDMDIELQILVEIKSLIRIGLHINQLEHVRAHQDEHKKIFDLSRDAQLNVRADRLAAQVASENLLTIEYSVPDACTASLVIQDQPITNRYRECISGAYDSQELREYMQIKYQWSDSVVEDIWWDSHGRALKRLSHADRQTIQKFIFHHLPTLRRERFKNKSIPDLCPHCHTETIENDDHIILCTSNIRMSAKRHWSQLVYSYLSKETTPNAVKQALMLGFHHWLLQQPSPNIEHHLPHLPPQVKAAYRAQAAIGWNHLIRGRLSTLWQPVIQQHLSTVPSNTVTSTTWATGLISELWNGVLSIWDVRNREYHGHDPATSQAALHSRLMQEAIPYLSCADRVHPNDRHWFQHTPVTLAEYNVISLKAWIRNARTMARIHHRESLAVSQNGNFGVCHNVMITNNETDGGMEIGGVG